MKAIVAMSNNRVIGNKGKIPWHFSEDFKWFKKTTMGGNLLMGRITFDSIGKALPGRKTFVLTTSQFRLALPPYDNLIYTTPALLDKVCDDEFWDKTWLCGGTTIYEQFIHKCTDVYATIVLNNYEGDAVMPEFEDQFPNSQIIQENKDFWIVHYWK